MKGGGEVTQNSTAANPRPPQKRYRVVPKHTLKARWLRFYRGLNDARYIARIINALLKALIVCIIFMASYQWALADGGTVWKAMTTAALPYQQVLYGSAKKQEAQFSATISQPVLSTEPTINYQRQVPQGTFRKIVGEPPHMWDEATKTCRGLKNYERAALAFFAREGIPETYWNGSRGTIRVPEDLYCYVKEAEYASGLPYWIPLGIGWSESPNFTHHLSENEAQASCWLQITRGTYSTCKHKPDATRNNKRDCTYGGVNHMIRIQMQNGINSEAIFVREFTTPWVWNAHTGQAHCAWRAGQAIKNKFEEFGRLYNWQ